MATVSSHAKNSSKLLKNLWELCGRSLRVQHRTPPRESQGVKINKTLPLTYNQHKCVSGSLKQGARPTDCFSDKRHLLVCSGTHNRQISSEHNKYVLIPCYHKPSKITRQEEIWKFVQRHIGWQMNVILWHCGIWGQWLRRCVAW